MKKRNVYLVQVDVLRKAPMFYTAYLPYTAGALWSYARQEPTVAEHYALREIFFLRDPIDGVLPRIENPFLVGFSCYCWSTEYNKALARAVKRAFPDCYILFGGHNVPPGSSMLEELPYVDFLMHGEGELGFQALLAQLLHAAPDFTAVPGLSYRTAGGCHTNPNGALDSLERCPSPFLEGIFDPIVAAHPEIQWSVAWETNRGCPHRCAYCDWGHHNHNVRQIPMDRLLAEIEWISANKGEFIWCADANFGILPRDEEILDALVAARDRKGFPQTFLSQTTHALSERTFRVSKKLYQSGLGRHGFVIALQSLSPEVLRNIGRQNPDDEALIQWIRRHHREGLQVYTDLILGLPGETLQSFCAGVEKVYRLGLHEGIEYFQCYLLPNAQMADPAYRQRHELRTAHKIFKHVLEDAAETAQIDEYIDTVIETAAMPHTDWLIANYFMILVKGLHGYGSLRLIAMFFHTEKIVPYASFYLRLLDFYHKNPDSLLGETMAHIEEHFSDNVLGVESKPLQISDFSFGRMMPDQYVFSRAVLDPERFYADAEILLRQFGLEPDLLAQLLCFQRESILLPGAAEKTLDFGYDFLTYFNAIYDGAPIPLQKKSVRLRFSCGNDLSSAEKYYRAVVQIGRLTNEAFYKVECFPK
ncbi:MAG: radical SAM protein [Firmicutes bacterium]|nr:radical SAM protein [Bacillota bacterium]